MVWATATPPAATLFARNAPGVAWRTKPSWYIVANNDQAVHPDLERAAAKRMGATTYDIDSSHVPMLSHPDYVSTSSTPPPAPSRLREQAWQSRRVLWSPTGSGRMVRASAN